MTDQPKHTPEPWEVQHHVGGSMVLPVDRDHTDTPIIVQRGPWRNCVADLSRIVACVNALAGIADPAAYLAELRQSLSTALQQVANVKEVAENRERELRSKVAELEAENSKLREVYKAAWEECRASRIISQDAPSNTWERQETVRQTRAERHDDARREAGMDGEVKP